jgi:dihydrofolate reductase
MAKLVFGMNQSLDGYVDYTALPPPSPALFRHFIEQTQNQVGSLYGRRLYEIMSYWDRDQDGWGDAERDFATAWRNSPKWVVSRTLKSVGPNATLLDGDLEPAIRKLKAEHDGVIEVGGPVLAKSLTDLGLIDEYHIFLHTPLCSAPATRYSPAPAASCRQRAGGRERDHVDLRSRLSRPSSSRQSDCGFALGSPALATPNA